VLITWLARSRIGCTAESTYGKIYLYSGTNHLFPTRAAPATQETLRLECIRL